MTVEEAFQILECSPTSTWEEAQLSHRTLSKVWHPDRFQDGSELQKSAEIKQRKLNEALETLRTHFGQERQTDSSQAEQTSEEYKSFNAKYHGGDPRIPLKNAACVIVIAREAIGILFSEEQHILIPANQILGFTQGGGPVFEQSPRTKKNHELAKHEKVKLWLADPEQVVRNFELSLTIENEYYAKVFAKHMKQTYGLTKFAPPPKAAVSNPATVDADKAMFAVVFVTVCFFALLFIISTFENAKKNYTPSTPAKESIDDESESLNQSLPASQSHKPNRDSISASQRPQKVLRFFGQEYPRVYSVVWVVDISSTKENASIVNSIVEATQTLERGAAVQFISLDDKRQLFGYERHSFEYGSLWLGSRRVGTVSSKLLIDNQSTVYSNIRYSEAAIRLFFRGLPLKN